MRKARPYHGAGILFWTKDAKGKLNLFLGKRSFNPGKNKWSIPGGGWEPQDGFEKSGKRNYRQTAIREAQEEIQFEILRKQNLSHLWSLHIPFFHFEVYAYNLSEQKIPSTVHEFSEVRWTPADALPISKVWFLRSQVATLVDKYPGHL